MLLNTLQCHVYIFIWSKSLKTVLPFCSSIVINTVIVTVGNFEP
jgi:hypothetical protein